MNALLSLASIVRIALQSTSFVGAAVTLPAPSTLGGCALAGGIAGTGVVGTP